MACTPVTSAAMQACYISRRHASLLPQLPCKPATSAAPPRSVPQLTYTLVVSNGGDQAMTGTVLTTFTGTFMPNLIRTKVLYLLGNMSVNDSISTDGLRNVLAKIPVNATYGGVIIYQPPEFNPPPAASVRQSPAD